MPVLPGYAPLCPFLLCGNLHESLHVMLGSPLPAERAPELM